MAGLSTKAVNCVKIAFANFATVADRKRVYSSMPAAAAAVDAQSRKLAIAEFQPWRSRGPAHHQRRWIGLAACLLSALCSCSR